MQLHPGRLRGMVADSLAADSFIACHKTLESKRAERAVCRGFYDRHRTNSLGCRLGAVVGIIEVNPDRKEAP